MKTQKKRILVVDNEARATRLLKLYLERTNNYVVREENNPEAALSAAEAFDPDLIMLDVMMPDVDGGELDARFQESPKLKGIPRVFVTAAITKEEVTACGGLIEGRHFLAKPVVLSEVAAYLKQHLGT